MKENESPTDCNKKPDNQARLDISVQHRFPDYLGLQENHPPPSWNQLQCGIVAAACGHPAVAVCNELHRSPAGRNVEQLIRRRTKLARPAIHENHSGRHADDAGGRQPGNPHGRYAEPADARKQDCGHGPDHARHKRDPGCIGQDLRH